MGSDFAILSWLWGLIFRMLPWLWALNPNFQGHIHTRPPIGVAPIASHKHATFETFFWPISNRLK